MAAKIFVNLPVNDLNKSMEFFKALGYTFNPQFTDHTAACMIISNDIYAMLLTHDKFQQFAPNGICDAKKTNEVLVALSLDSREQVGDIMKKAFAAGGKKYAEPKDYGFMIQDGFQDLDGHIWELIYMDPAAIQQG